MKLLFDENLSRRLVQRLADLYAGSAHVVQFDLLTSPDEDVWNCALQNGFVIVSADADFYDRAIASGPPPKVIWLRNWRYPTRDAEAVLRREAIRIAHFWSEPELGILILDRHGPPSADTI